MGSKFPQRLWQRYQATRFHQVLNRRNGRGYLLGTLLLTVVIGGGTVLWLQQHPVSFSGPIAIFNVEEETEEPKVYYSDLNGEKVSKAASKRPVTAVIIENTPPARPQSGLKKADLVFEAIAEAGITRFMALYQQSQPNLVGPVRSLRPYFLKWASGFNASIAHVGGSPKALRMIRSGNYNVADIDQFFYASYYWRSNDRRAPHNMYTSFQKLSALNKKVGHTSSEFDSFNFKKDNPAKNPEASVVNVDMSSYTYHVKYQYRPQHNDYLRFMAGSKHVDNNNGQISPKVVIVIRVNERTVMQDTYREKIEVIGSGTAYIFQDGRVTKGRWVKKAAGKTISFVNQKGQPIALNRGQIWITALPKGRALTWH